MRIKSSSARLTAIGVAALLGLAACSAESGDDEPESSVDAETESEESPTEEATVDEDSEVTVTIAVTGFGNDTMDPAMEARGLTGELLLPMYDSLLEVGTQGEMAPGVAETWEVSDDGKTWTFNLRQGIEFHDGWGELTAEDVKFSLERFMNEEATSTQAGTLRETVESVEVINPYTVAVTTNEVTVNFPYLVSTHGSEAGMIFSREYMTTEGGESFSDQMELLGRAPVGSGPFRFVERTAGDLITYEAVDNHWRATPTIDRLTYLLIPETTTQVAMVQAGEIDIASITGDQVDLIEAAGLEVRNIPGIIDISIPIPGTYRVTAESKPTANAEVRRALSLAINREEILATRFDGFGSLPTTPTFTAPYSDGLDESAMASWAGENSRYDPEEAKAILADAGYPDGFSIDLHLYPRPGTPWLPDVGEIVAGYWAEIGVEANMFSSDYAAYRPSWVRAEDNDPRAGDPTTYSGGSYHSALQMLETFALGDGGVVQLLNDPEVDALVNEMRTTVDDDERREVTTRALDVLNDEWVLLSLFSLDALYAVNPDSVGDWDVYPGVNELGRTFERVQLPS